MRKQSLETTPASPDKTKKLINYILSQQQKRKKSQRAKPQSTPVEKPETPIEVSEVTPKMSKVSIEQQRKESKRKLDAFFKELNKQLNEKAKDP